MVTTTNYIWNPVRDSCVMEKDETGTTTAVYTSEPVQYGRVVSQRRDNATTYYHYDGLGSTRELTDESENVVNTNLYNAWGVNVDSSETVENPFKWVGEWGYYDDGLLGYYVRARQWDPEVARWRSRDPLGWVDDVHLYRYAHNSPLENVDPSGMQGWLLHPPVGSGWYDPATGRECKPYECKCGANVGKQYRAALYDLIMNFLKAGASARAQACSDLTTWSPRGLKGWDSSFAFAKRTSYVSRGCGTGFAADGWGTVHGHDTVTIDGQCYRSAEVGYYVWGLGNRLCALSHLHGFTRTSTIARVLAYRIGLYPLHVLYGDADVAGRVAWARAGWDLSSFPDADQSDAASKCEPCDKEPSAVDVVWIYIGIPPFEIKGQSFE